jgi:hypothetical protein
MPHGFAPVFFLFWFPKVYLLGALGEFLLHEAHGRRVEDGCVRGHSLKSSLSRAQLERLVATKDRLISRESFPFPHAIVPVYILRHIHMLCPLDNC